MVKKPPPPDMGPNTIYKATYSGVPVYEFICKTVAVMRRRADDYLNATQILKVAGFDKPQRTRVLEREVQKGEHEKIQGGYGKFQGTWVPIERGLALAKQYNVEDLLRPIIDYRPTSQSPPPAPKHVVAAPSKRKEKEPKGSATPVKTGPHSAAAIQAQALVAATNRARVVEGGTSISAPPVSSTPDSRRLSPEESEYGTPADEMSESATPSPVRETPTGMSGVPRIVPSSDPYPRSDMMDVDTMQLENGLVPAGMTASGSGSGTRKRTAGMMDEDEYEALQHARGSSAVHTPRGSPHPAGFSGLDAPLSQDEYNDIVLNYFVSESTQIPSVLTSPPYNWNPNAPIDDDHHTPLHWAAAMGRTRVIKLLLSAGARIFDKNNLEQTALMRSVMFTNNYDLRKFPEVFELLHRSTLNIDKQNRTVFHHIANLALIKGKTHAARYYMEVILSRLADYPQELADVINFQDEDGETALTLAARARSKRIVKALLDHGADPKIRNRDFKSAEDYILEDERFRSSPDLVSRPANGASSLLSRGSSSLGASVFQTYHPQLYTSEAARLAGGQYLADITSHLQSLARSYDSELCSKERDIAQAKSMLTSIHAEVSEAGRTLHELGEQTKGLEELEQEVERLQATLRKAVVVALKKGFEIWLSDEMAREARWKNGEDPSKLGEDYSDLARVTAAPLDGEEESLRWEIGEKKKRRLELVEKFANAQAEAGTSGKLDQYRRLISASGDVSPGELDSVVEQVLETLEAETQRPFASTPGGQWVA